MNVAVLIFVAVAEAIVWLWRLRSGVGASRWQAGASAALVCLTRMVWLWAGVKATLEGSPVVGTIAYCGAAGVATTLVHGWGKGMGAGSPQPRREEKAT